MNEPWRDLRDLEPPPGSRERVFGAIQAEVRHLRGWNRALLAAVPVAVAGAVAVVWLVGTTAEPSRSPGVVQPDEVAAVAIDAGQGARIATAAEPSLEAPDAAPTAEIRLAARERMAIDFAGAEVSVQGPALVRVGDDVLLMEHGRVVINGATTIRAPMCDARVAGRAQVVVDASEVLVTVIAGTAEVTPGVPGCTVLHRELQAPTPADLRDPGDTVAVTRGRGRSRHAAAEPSALRGQIEAFKQARALRATDREQALRMLAEINVRWPTGALRQEVDGLIVDILSELDRLDEARKAARLYLENYPGSPRSDDMRALVGWEPQ